MKWLACLNLSGVKWGKPRATMRVAPDDPQKPLGFESRFLCQDPRQAGRPFVSSIAQLSQNLEGESWYSNNHRVRRSRRLALFRIGCGAQKSPRLRGRACWPARRGRHLSAAVSAALAPNPSALFPRWNPT